RPRAREWIPRSLFERGGTPHPPDPPLARSRRWRRRAERHRAGSLAASSSSDGLLPGARRGRGRGGSGGAEVELHLRGTLRAGLRLEVRLLLEPVEAPEEICGVLEQGLGGVWRWLCVVGWISSVIV